jgi:hypothetical protein
MSSALTVTRIGHACQLIEIGGIRMMARIAPEIDVRLVLPGITVAVP